MANWGMSMLTMSSGILFGGFFVLLAVIIMWEYRRLRRQRRTHLATHSPMGDDAFLAEIGVRPEWEGIALRLRKGVAGAMGVPSETVLPTDSLRYVLSYGFDGLSFGELLIVLRDKRDDPILAEEFWKEFHGESYKELERKTVAELVRYAVPRLGRDPDLS